MMRPHVVDPHGNPLRALPHWARRRDYDDEAEGWYFKLGLAFGLDINDDRDEHHQGRLHHPHLLVGADDGAARGFKVHLNWTAVQPDTGAGACECIG